MLGWDDEGHRVISGITGLLLTDKAKFFLYEHLVAKTRMQLKDALMSASIWADKEGRTLHPGSNELHFAFTEYQKCRAYVESDDCGPDGSGSCIVTGITINAKRAADSSLTPEQRAEAIRFLLHFVSDAHQPLHVGFKQDRGGKLIAIDLEHPSETKQALPTDLHKLWDSYLLDTYRLKHGNKARWRPLARIILNESEHVGEIKELTSMADASSFAADIVSETATRITCDIAYKNEFGVYFNQASKSLITPAYVDRAIGAMKLQFFKAARRLANLLDVAASDYYASSGPAKIKVGVKSSNGFAALEDTPESEPVESAFYVNSRKNRKRSFC